jgi:hypothetical protein
MLRSTPHHSNYGGGFAPSGGSFARCYIFFLSNLLVWSDDAIMTSPALLTDAVPTSLELLAILVGVAFIGLVGV